MGAQSLVDEPELRCLMVKEEVDDSEVVPPDPEGNHFILMIDAMNVVIEDTMQEIVLNIKEEEDTGMGFLKF